MTEVHPDLRYVLDAAAILSPTRFAVREQIHEIHDGSGEDTSTDLARPANVRSCRPSRMLFIDIFTSAGPAPYNCMRVMTGRGASG